jgi:hypothetical protein
MALNATDGRYTYFRNPIAAESLVYAYTAMPTQFHSFMSREELAQAQLGRFLSHTYNIPVYKVPQQGKVPHRHSMGSASEQPDTARHELYDLIADPGQNHPLAAPEVEARFCELLRGHLMRVQAPTEQFERLGL